MAFDLFTDDLSAVTNDELYSAIKSFAEASPSEGWRHDFTTEWCNSALTKIAAFANTFGGLLLVGIGKGKGDPTCTLLGVESPNEYKTGIASSISANISPTPSFEVYECSDPAKSNRKFCVVRVRPGKALYLVTKKGLDPVYVRNEDEARRADAAQLRSLIDREKEMATGAQRACERARSLAERLFVFEGYQSSDPATWAYSPCRHSLTFLKLALVPSETIQIELERSAENRLVGLVNEAYPVVHRLVGQSRANDVEGRGADSYEYVWYYRNLGYEARWRVEGDGAIGHSTQMAYRDGQKDVWSVVDLASYIVAFFRLSMKWWRANAYFGEGELCARLGIRGLTLLRSDASGAFGRGFGTTYDPAFTQGGGAIPPDAIIVSGRPAEGAQAEIKLTYFTATERLPRLATSLLNSLLRSLGHAVVWGPLEEGVRLLAGG